MNCPRLQAPHGVADGAAGRRRGLALELHQQETPHCQLARQLLSRLPHEVQEGAIQQLDRRRVQRHEIGDRVGQRVEVRKAEDHAAHVRGDRLEAPFDCGHDSERALRSDEQVQLVRGLCVAVQRVAARALAGAGEAVSHQLARRGLKMPAGRAVHTPLHAPGRPVVVDHLDGLDPAAHAPAAHRTRARRVRGDHAARRREPTRRRVGRQAQAERARGLIHLGPGHRCADPERALAPIRDQPVEPLTQVHDHSPADAPARHPTPCAARHERRARRRRPAHQLLRLFHSVRDGDARGDDAVDPGTLRVSGPETGVGRDRGRHARHRARYAVRG